MNFIWCLSDNTLAMQPARDRFRISCSDPDLQRGSVISDTLHLHHVPRPPADYKLFILLDWLFKQVFIE